MISLKDIFIRSPLFPLRVSSKLGFRKLRTDPILTSDVDPRTACFVRFYHEKFQKGQPDLLHQIKRATKSDQQSKDDVESLKLEVCQLKECISQISSEMDRKLTEMNYEYNRRITNLSAEYDKLAALMTQVLARQQQQQQQQDIAGEKLSPPVLHHSPPQPTTTTVTVRPSFPPAAAEATTNTCTTSNRSPPRAPDLMRSLSQVAAMSLQNQLRSPSPATTYAGIKRSAQEEEVVAISRVRTN